jgi:hypothetical protein
MIPSLRSSFLFVSRSSRLLSVCSQTNLSCSCSCSFTKTATESTTTIQHQQQASTIQTFISSGNNNNLFFSTPTLLKPMRSKRRLPQREPQAGDWLCSCGHSNSKFRRDCIKCNGPAPPLPLGESRPKLPGEDPHDWACACGKMNYRGNVSCHKCGMPKPAAPESEQKNQMWKCAKCACLNRVNRKFCFQCRALQTISGVAVSADGKTTAAGGGGGGGALGGGTPM